MWKSIQWVRKIDVHCLCSQETGVQIDRENSNVDEPNIHDSSKTNDVNAEQANSIVDDDVEQMMYPKILFKAYKTKLIVMMLGWKKQMRWKVVQ